MMTYRHPISVLPVCLLSSGQAVLYKPKPFMATDFAEQIPHGEMRVFISHDGNAWRVISHRCGGGISLKKAHRACRIVADYLPALSPPPAPAPVSVVG